MRRALGWKPICKRMFSQAVTVGKQVCKITKKKQISLELCSQLMSCSVINLRHTTKPLLSFQDIENCHQRSKPWLPYSTEAMLQPYSRYTWHHLDCKFALLQKISHMTGTTFVLFILYLQCLVQYLHVVGNSWIFKYVINKNFFTFPENWIVSNSKSWFAALSSGYCSAYFLVVPWNGEGSI